MLLFSVKLLHSFVIIYLLICLYVVWMFALHGFYRRWLVPAIGSFVLEAIVWIGSGWRCPLTDWAIALGDDDGTDLLMDLLLVQPVNYEGSYVAFFLVGTALSLWRIVKIENHSWRSLLQ